jgi:serine/threonine protein kinase
VVVVSASKSTVSLSIKPLLLTSHQVLRVYRARRSQGETEQFSAVKIVVCQKSDPSLDKNVKTIQKEVRVHATLKNQNILKLISHQEKKDERAVIFWIILEYASGDLFDKICEFSIETYRLSGD